MISAAALTLEAKRLADLADDAEARLRALEARAESAREIGIPGPTAVDLAHARRLAAAARAAADGALRHARPIRRGAQR